MRMPEASHGLRFTEPVGRWDEALPLGNGLLGCLVWGDGAPLRFSLDRGDLWDTRLAPQAKRPDFTYANLVRLVRESRHDEVKALYEDPYRWPTPTKIPAGRLELDFGGTAAKVASVLDLGTAEAAADLDFADGRHASVRAILHADGRFGLIRVEGAAPKLLLRAHRFNGPDDGKKSDVSYALCSALGYPDPVPGSADGLEWFTQETAEDGPFGVVAATRPLEGGGLQIAWTVASGSDGPAWLAEAQRLVRDACALDYGAALEGHAAWWRAYWAKSSVSLPDPALERIWYRSNYLFGACSRKGCPPMPLQGVWTADEDGLPPWKGDYHGDLNTQMSYSHFVRANRLEEGESFLDFLWDLVPAAKAFARDFYDAPGICMPTVMGIHGEPLGGWVQYSYTLVGQAWSAFAFYEYWKCTAREDFLRARAYPYLRMSAECALRWLAPDAEGWLRLPLSCSPEIHDDRPEAWMRPDTNNDLALLKFLFGALAEMAAALGDPEEARWKETLSRIGPYHLEKNGGLMVSADEALTESHRHFGHAMGLHPLRLLDVVGDPSARRTLDATVGRLERLGSGNWIGFSFAWMASLYALQGNGEGAAHQLRTFEECICSPNGFHLNGDYRKRGVTHFHYRPFTLESNMGAACAVQDMLLDAAHGRLRPFPATPAAWRAEGVRVAFEDLRAEGGLLVSAELTNGTLSYMVVRAEKDADLLFENVFPTDSIRIEIDGKEVRRTACRPGETFALRLEKGRACRLSAG